MTDEIETISAEEYRDERATAVERLVDYARTDVKDADTYDTARAAALDLVTDALDAHKWFVQNHSGYGPAAHGCIVEHSEGDANRFTYVLSLTESSDPEEILRRTAHIAFESDVLRMALDRLSDE
jgi:hypothetical protein